MSRYNLFLKISNVVAYILVIAVNTAVQFKGYENSKPDEPISNSTLIYAAETATIEGIRFYHVIASILNAAFLLIWGNSKIRVLIDAFVLTTLCLAVFRAYDNVTTHYPPKDIKDRLFIHYPFTIYAAWSLVATFLNYWAAIPFLNTVFFSTVAIIVLGIIGYDYNKHHDAVFSATIAWALVGIAVRQQDTMAILIASSVSSGVILGGILRKWINTGYAYRELRRNRLRDVGETDPLLA
ncbi:tryptophan-rich sensory protein [Rhizophagus clarus]|uniref:Tryptophan-rich sensory protein n=1 Tax=Rhizophagus clarus TaxID=94130 RepID=A0A8H3LD19_9GLOM|nr:tryptophan-rich sensory protein [Rhizophagus clarus]